MLDIETAEFSVSFFCYYETNLIKHFQKIKLSDIPRWVNSYQFTHPDVKSISVKIWLNKTDFKW